MEQEMTAELVRVSFVRINAELGEGPKLTGGHLKVETSVSLSEKDDNPREAIARVSLLVMGIPKGESDDGQFAFKIEIAVQGLYAWPEGKRPKDLKDKNLLHLFCQPLYPLAVAEVTNIAPRLGFNGVVIPWDFKTEEPPQAAVKKTKKSAPSVAATGRKPAAKNKK